MRKTAEIHETLAVSQLPPGALIAEGATSWQFITGDWRTLTPSWDESKCKQCLLCFPVCPDSSIPVRANKRVDFDYNHCKGCGICAKVCPANAISIGKAK